MNKTEQAQQLRLAADIFETGHPFEVRHDTSEKWHPSRVTHPARAVLEGWHLRPILATPPDGRPLHNPDKLTAGQVGVGYRLALIDEKTNENEALQEFWNKGEWMTSGRVYSDTFGEAPNHRITYRLPLSVPWPEAKPDPYAELKAAHAAGKAIEAQMPNGEWFDYNPDKPQWNLQPECYRIKPDAPAFQLPPPPPGMRWHREDGWEEGDLPQGYRPLVEGERIRRGDEGIAQYSFVSFETMIGKFPIAKARTTRPLVFTHEGKEWTYHKPGDPMPCDGERQVCLYRLGAEEDCDVSNKGKDWFWKDETIIGWRYAETTKQVELGPEDVPPGSVVTTGAIKGAWASVVAVDREGVIVASRITGTLKRLTYAELLLTRKINRPRHRDADGNPTLWEPCHKTLANG